MWNKKTTTDYVICKLRSKQEYLDSEHNHITKMLGKIELSKSKIITISNNIEDVTGVEEM